jgi:putative Holliday junction resolvase
MALDIGDKRIGVALSDPGQVLASPLTVISEREKETAIKAILELAHQYQVKHIVVGLPRSLNGGIGSQARSVQEFIKQLSECVDIPVDSWDERFSTIAADKMMLDTQVKKRRRKARQDSAAAALILQGYLERMNVEFGTETG